MCVNLCQPRLTTAIRSEWRMANAWSYPPNGTICEEANWGQADAGRAAVRTDATLAPPARSRRRASTSVELRIGRGAGRSARARRRASISARTSNRSRGPPKRRSADPARGRTTTTRRHANHQPVQRRRPPLVAISPRGASSCHGPSSAALGWDKGIRREAAPPSPQAPTARADEGRARLPTPPCERRPPTEARTWSGGRLFERDAVWFRACSCGARPPGNGCCRDKQAARRRVRPGSPKGRDIPVSGGNIRAETPNVPPPQAAGF